MLHHICNINPKYSTSAYSWLLSSASWEGSWRRWSGWPSGVPVHWRIWVKGLFLGIKLFKLFYFLVWVRRRCGFGSDATLGTQVLFSINLASFLPSEAVTRALNLGAAGWDDCTLDAAVCNYKRQVEVAIGIACVRPGGPFPPRQCTASFLLVLQDLVSIWRPPIYIIYFKSSTPTLIPEVTISHRGMCCDIYRWSWRVTSTGEGTGGGSAV